MQLRGSSSKCGSFGGKHTLPLSPLVSWCTHLLEECSHTLPHPAMHCPRGTLGNALVRRMRFPGREWFLLSQKAIPNFPYCSHRGIAWRGIECCPDEFMRIRWIEVLLNHLTCSTCPPTKYYWDPGPIHTSHLLEAAIFRSVFSLIHLLFSFSSLPTRTIRFTSI